LKDHGTDELVEKMFEMGDETMNLPIEEKMAFEQGDDGRSFGYVLTPQCSPLDTTSGFHSFSYKAAGANATDEHGNLDTVEFLNVSRDDALAFPNAIHRTYPHTVEARMAGTITPFVKASMEITNVLIDCIGKKMGLPNGMLDDIHSTKDYSGCGARIIKNPPVDDKEISKDKVALGAHTDFGSLVNVLGISYDNLLIPF
jgi:isopenicillin N synthase-like dioxygenase